MADTTQSSFQYDMEEDWDFDEWIKKYNLSSIKPFLVKHDATTRGSFQLAAPQFRNLWSSKEVKGWSPEIFSNLCKAAGECHKWAEEKEKESALLQTTLITMDVKEEEAIDQMAEIEKKLQDMETEFADAKSPLLEKIATDKKTQITATKATIHKVFGDICKAYQAEERALLEELDKIIACQSTTVDADVNIASKSLKRIESEKQTLKKFMEQCDDHLRGEKLRTQSTEERIKEVLAIAEKSKKEYDAADNELNHNLKEMNDIIQGRLSVTYYEYTYDVDAVNEIIAKSKSLGRICASGCLENYEVNEEVVNNIVTPPPMNSDMTH